MKKLLIYTFIFLQIACIRTFDNPKPIGLFPIKEYGKWGYINSNGETIIKCQFDEANNFSEGLASVKIDNLWGFIDTTGKLVIEPQFYFTSEFSDGLCKVYQKVDSLYKISFICKDGSTAFTTDLDDVESFYFSRAKVKINDEICYLNKKGEIIINTHYPHGSSFSEGVAAVWSGDSSKYIDTTGKTIVFFNQMNGSDFSEGLALVQVKNKRYYIDRFGNTKIDLKRQGYTYFDFSDGLAMVTISGPNHKSGFIDKSDNLVIPIEYDNIYDFHDGLAAYEANGKWGFIDKTGKTIIYPKFESVDYNGFKYGLCLVVKDHVWGYINKKGNFVWKALLGVEYKKLDFAKWDLDTLEINAPLYVNRFADGANFPRKQTFSFLHELTFKIDTLDITVFSDKYLGYKIYLINATKDTLIIPLQDGSIKIIQQALNKNGEWQDIEDYINSWCGNSYYSTSLAPREFLIFTTPIFKGEFTTQLRFRLELGNQILYSNSYSGQINFGQFISDEEKDKTEIVTWSY